VPGVLAMAEAAREGGAAGIAVSAENAAEARLIDGLSVSPLRALRELREIGDPSRHVLEPPGPEQRRNGAGPDALPDLADVRGQDGLRRALEVAAAGGHSLLVTGPPGAGKSLAAQRLPSILPPLSRDEAIEVTRIASACGRSPAPGTLAGRPFRAPHHTISAAGLVGGGNPLRPGEVTLAHGGVLFLDELGEFSRPALEALRQPLEEGSVVVTRARYTVTLPCRFMLVAAANRCPCGRGEESEHCRCSPVAVRGYNAKLSGALADRIDICVSVDQPPAETMAGPPGEPSRSVRARVVAARERQAARLGPGRVNALMSPAQSRAHGRLDSEARAMLADGHARLGLSGRGYERVLRLARTLADLDGSEGVRADHVGEALMLRRRSTRP
jgi:magnesium chelatase family protein